MDVDPQYLCKYSYCEYLRNRLQDWTCGIYSWLTWPGILPRALELTPEFKNELNALEKQDWKAASIAGVFDPMDPFTSTDTKRIAGPWLWKYHLGSLIERYSPPKDYLGMLKCYINKDELEYKKDDWAIFVNDMEYTVMKRRLLSLQHVGLDFQGGLERLYYVSRECTPCALSVSSPSSNSQKVFPTTSIIVIDSQEAAKYFRFGVHLNKVWASLSNYPAEDSLDQAMKIYSTIKELVQGHSREKMPTEAELDASISAATIEENSVWEYKRDKFRLATVKKCRDIMIQKAVEENVSLLLWCIRLS